MIEQWIPLNSLPASGSSFTIDDAMVWSEPVREFGMTCTFRVPMRAEVFLLPQEGGCFVRGHLTGEVSLPCDRCSEEAVVALDHRFEGFEPMPEAEADEEDAEFDERVMRLGDSGPEVNLASLLWEEFSLALPVHPLCSPECKGLCPTCGNNLNAGSCSCSQDEGDPRLAALRGLTIKK